MKPVLKNKIYANEANELNQTKQTQTSTENYSIDTKLTNNTKTLTSKDIPFVSTSNQFINIEKIFVIDNDLDYSFQVSSKQREEEVSSYLRDKLLDYDPSVNSLFSIVKENDEKISKLKNTYNDHSKIKIQVLTLDKEKMKSVLKCVGYRFSQSLKYSKEVFDEFSKLIGIKFQNEYDLISDFTINDNNDDISNKSRSVSIICKCKLFYSITKNIIIKEYKKKVHLKRYFHLAYMILGKKIIFLSYYTIILLFCYNIL